MNYHSVVERLIDLYEAGYNNATLVSELRQQVEAVHGQPARIIRQPPRVKR